MDLPELKPCPFCGATGGMLKFRKRTHQHDKDFYSLYIRCFRCNAHGPMIHCKKDATGPQEWQALADAWNHRAAEAENDTRNCSDT